MTKVPLLKAREVMKVLEKLGFEFKRQRGSHLVLKKETPEGKVGTVVPMHKEIKLPTLKNVLKLAKVDEEEFIKYQQISSA